MIDQSKVERMVTRGVFFGFVVFSLAIGGDAFRGGMSETGYFLDAAQTKQTHGILWWISLVWGSIALGSVVLLVIGKITLSIAMGSRR